MKKITSYTKKLALNLKKKRIKLNLSQIQLSKLSNVSQSIINKIENKKIEPLYSTVKKLEETLELLEKKQDKKLKEIKTEEIKKININKNLQEALELMIKYDYSQIIVEEKKELVGVIYNNTILKLIQKKKDLEKIKVKEYYKEIPILLDENLTIKEVECLFKKIPFALTKQKNKITGIITKTDIFLQE